MKRSLFVPIVLMVGLCALAGTAFPQAQKKADIVGTWIGHAVVGADGTQIEIIMVIGETDQGYSARLSDTSGMVPETELTQVAFKDNKLTCEFDFQSSMHIRIELLLENETLKGAWFSATDESGVIELALKK